MSTLHVSLTRVASLALLTTATLVVGCDREAAARSDGAPPPSAAPVAANAPTSPSVESPRPNEPRLTLLSPLFSGMADVASGRAADTEHPAGTTFIAAIVAGGTGKRGKPMLFEWDIASASSVHPTERLLYMESDKVDDGASVEVRITTSHGDLFGAVTLEGEFARQLVLGRTSHADGYIGSLYPRADFPPARDISLETDGHWLAVGYERTHVNTVGSDLPGTGIALFDTKTMKRVAAMPFTQSHEPNVRYDNLEIMNGRLFAAEPMGSKLRVVELAMPSLRPLHAINLDAPGPSSIAQLTSAHGSLFALRNGMLTELTPDLAIVAKREIHASEIAPGPNGEFLTPIGLDAAGARGDFVPNVHTTASCTPAWTGAYPLLACAVDLGGVKIARLAPVAR